MEIWRVIQEFPTYEVSSLGRIRNIKTGLIRKQNIDRDGYAWLTLSKEGKYHYNFVHRLVCKAFNGSPTPNKPSALHRDDDKSNNTPGNLYWGNEVNNHADRVKHGLDASGERHGRAILDWNKVREIRARYPKENQYQLADTFGVSQVLIGKIVRNELWKENNNV